LPRLGFPVRNCPLPGQRRVNRSECFLVVAHSNGENQITSARIRPPVVPRWNEPSRLSELCSHLHRGL
jgi:hypothetical protein